MRGSKSLITVDGPATVQRSGFYLQINVQTELRFSYWGRIIYLADRLGRTVFGRLRPLILTSAMRMTTPKHRKLEPNSDLVNLVEGRRDGVKKTLEKMRPEGGRPKNAERPSPNPKSMEVQDG